VPIKIIPTVNFPFIDVDTYMAIPSPICDNKNSKSFKFAAMSAQFNRTTETESKYTDLEQKSTGELLTLINSEDHSVPVAVSQCLLAIETLVDALVFRMRQGGRLFYMGAGTSGRLGVVDASECPPTFGVSFDLVIGLIAGGDQAIRKAVEFAEDDTEQGWLDLQAYKVGPLDTVIGIAASGSTPYVASALQKCRKEGISTGCIVCNSGSPIAQHADYPIEVIVGPEFVTGSTRMKSGTAQKLVLNMISTATMIQLGHVKGNRMVDMQLTNNKLVDRGTQMVMDQTGLDEAEAQALLKQFGNVRKAVEYHILNT
jgi:N-acetylmuramic acid 6-phosphate etherase